MKMSHGSSSRKLVVGGLLVVVGDPDGRV